MTFPDSTYQWRPGSFTKNFTWGPKRDGLRQLHESIRIGFEGEARDVPRNTFRARVKSLQRPDFIAINFFLFNKIIDGVDHIIADELVFQAVTTDHSTSFDKLAVFAFNLSLAGRWKSAAEYQRWPALWAHHYIKSRLARDFSWDASKVNADDIHKFVGLDKRYKAQDARKLATNLNYIYKNGNLSGFNTRKVERWWVDALFLALDRAIEDARIDDTEIPETRYASLLNQVDFKEISGPASLEKDLAVRHLIALYAACGARDRFCDDHVRHITQLEIPDVAWLLANDTRPQGAVHPTNPNVLKNIPRACAWLAKYAGFDVIDADELATFDPAEFVRRRTRNALRELQEANVRPTMSAEELTKITRER